MHFLILTQYYEPEIGAAQVRLASFIRELRRAGHSGEVVTSLPNYPTGKIFKGYKRRVYVKELRGEVPVHRVWLYAAMGRGLSRILNYFSFAGMSLFGLALAKRPDYVFVESPPLTLAVSAIVFSRFRKTPVILNVSDLWPDTLVELGLLRDGAVLRSIRMLERWVYRNADYVSAITEGLGRRLRTEKSVPPAKMLFLPNGVDTDFFAPRPPDEELRKELGLAGKKIVAYTGTFGYVHALDLVVESLALVQERNPNIAFVFMGDGSEKGRIVALARERKLANAVFLPPRPPADVARLYSLAFAGVCATRNVASFATMMRPAKMWQIMGCGKPVIYFGPGEGAEIVRNADAGIIVVSGKPLGLDEHWASSSASRNIGH